MERVGRLDSGAYAAIVNWYAENASATAATRCAAKPCSSRLAPVSSKAGSSGWARSRGFMAKVKKTLDPCLRRDDVDAPRASTSLHDADFLVILFRARMQ